MRRFDVIGFGALNVDKLFKVNRIAGAEEESFIIDYSETCGGSAANTMVGLARLGAHVGFIGKVGDDEEGGTLLESFRKENVDTNGTKVARSGRSGKVMGFVDDDGQRALYIDPGVNDEINSDDVDPDYVLNTSFLHLSSFVGERSFETQRNLVDRFADRVKISLDPGALYARAGLTKLKSIIDSTFVMMPNAIELRLLTGERKYRTGAKSLIDHGVKVVAVKLGNKGCYVTDAKESYLVEPFQVEVLDTTGAGDAFDAGFIYGLLSGKGLRECARIGNFVASRCIMAMGARTSLPMLKDLRTLKQA